MTKMIRVIKALTALTLLTGLAACGERAEVPVAHYGKILTKDGFAPGIINPSKFRLPFCMAYCDKLIIVESSDSAYKENFKLFMPKDQLNMGFDIRMTLSIKNDEKTLNALFDRVPAKPVGYQNIIPKETIYEIYGQPLIRNHVRTILAEYAINEVASSRAKINSELHKKMSAAFKSTPFVIKRIDLADVQFPDVITQQKELAAKRRIAIETEEAEKQIALIKLQTELEKARAERNIRKEKAAAVLEENNIVAKSVTPAYLAYKKLEVLEQMATNKNAVFVPLEALSTLGLQNKIFQQKEK